MADGSVAASPRTPPATSLLDGECQAWPLALDATCAAQARRMFRDAAAAVGLSDDLAYEGMTMASELAANTLHAHDNVQCDGAVDLPVAGAPELWLYLRRVAGRWELVCKIFDSLREWKGGASSYGPAARSELAVGGRGLQVVAGLSGGRWGHHLTRARLGGWRVPGKAVWFALPAPAPSADGRSPARRLQPCQAASGLEAMLVERGLGRRLMRVDEPQARLSVLSVCSGLTVWCRSGSLAWRTRQGSYERRDPADLVEVAEQIVCLCEEIDAVASPRD